MRVEREKDLSLENVNKLFCKDKYFLKKNLGF